MRTTRTGRKTASGRLSIVCIYTVIPCLTFNWS